VNLQIVLNGNPMDWAPLVREFIAGRFELLRLSMPGDLLLNLPLDPALFAIVVYVQLGFLLLVYLFRGDVRDLRAQLVNLEARYESSLREQSARVADLAGDGEKRQEGTATAGRNVSLIPGRDRGEEQTDSLQHFLTAHHEPESHSRPEGLPVPSKNRKVAEMAGQGAGRRLISDSLHLRPAEVDFLLRVHRLEQNSGDRQPV
jgi:hypothetical protein